MRGIVYGSTFEKAETQLEKIIEDYKMIGIEVNERHGLRVTRNSIDVDFTNGDWWTAVKASENSHRRCNIAYIDHDIDPNIINCVIKPTITSYPYQAIMYY